MAVVAVVVCVCIIIHFDVNKSMPIFNETPQSVEKSSTLRHHPLSQPCRSHAITFFFFYLQYIRFSCLNLLFAPADSI